MSLKQPPPPIDLPSQSVRQSSQSTATSRSSSKSSRSHPAVESNVTRLLVSIKLLLESLTKWANQQATEDEVSDVYVRLGNDFNAAVAAFASYNIDMSELMAVPDDLRGVLEDCLSEDATQKNLDKYLPKVRAIITGLLQGLRGKQHTFRQIVSGQKHRSDASSHTRADSSSLSRSSRGHSRRDTKSSTTSVDDPPSRRTTASSSRRKESGSYNVTPNGEDAFVGGFAPTLAQPTPSTASSSGVSSDRYSGSPQISRHPSANASIPPPAPPPPQSPPPPPPHEPDKDATPTPPARAMQPQVPANVKRYSLVDKPVPAAPPPPSVVIDEPAPQTPVEDGPPDPHDRAESLSPPPDTPPLDNLSNPGVASSLAALKQSDTLERRASKRFSVYHISKMTGTPRDRSGLGSGHPNRRSLVAGAGGALTAGELAVLTEADEEEEAPSPARVRREVSRSRSRGKFPLAEPPVPRLPVPQEALTKSEVVAAVNGVPATKAAADPSPETPGGPITVFLQVGREVKKANVEPGLTFASLRILFVDKFAYSPGQENFPAIYIRDPSSGVQYELEDMEEVQDKCLLSLNIEPLDQIKQHIDTQIAGLAQELRDLSKSVTDNRRTSYIGPLTQSLSDSTVPPAARPTDHHFQTVARRVSRIIRDDPSSVPLLQAPIVPEHTGQSLLQPQFTGASVMSEYSNRVVTDLKTQFDEVQNLRRDLGIMRQLYTEFMKQTKESLGTLRTQTQNVRQMASTQVPGARAYIDTGKQKLDVRSQNVLTKMEELQDTVESVKDDVLKRHVSPKPAVLKTITTDFNTVATELESLKDHIKTIKPMWKKTWEEELQSIVEEQQFLNHQEEFLADLLEDHKATVEIWGHVEKVISLRGASGSRGPRTRGGFRPPPPDEGHTGLSTVMLEIRGANVDAERRLKAIEASQRTRQKELAGRSDEFEEELKGFVGGKKLKMTGGAEEVERVRQHRNEMTLKAMFNPE
ncbi:AIP3-domain-containing protein [Auriscalpium vulgare]|uniref:AIP3-domain-containing protein n=1 Tax=Auriscalpium vulgare TaxID=40419 RepID=A0ACB8RP59_9AGAM|nr:AIP3-domain-containing protein [Auriscalpium vulgare]